MSKVLVTQTAIRRGIRDIFSDRRQRRVAFVAFVGKGAQVYTGNPAGLTVVCWPRAGGTNPYAVEALRRRGADVYFADRLHMKVYWSPRGAIIGSPNLSSNALGAGDLRECAVRVPSARVDVDALWKSLDPRPVDRASLAKLHREHAEYRRRNKGSGRQPQPRRTFSDWHRDGSRERWAFSWWDSVGRAAKRARALAAEFGSDTVENFVACGKGELSKDTWVLLGKKSTRGMFADPQWLYVHGVVLVDASERRGGASGYAYQAVQACPLRMCPRPPFDIDGAFRHALRSWRKAIGSETFGDTVLGERALPVTKNIADALEAHYRTETQ